MGLPPRRPRLRRLRRRSRRRRPFWRRDPFGQAQAANLAAFYGVGQVLPGLGDAVSDTPISQPKRLGQLLFVVGVCAVSLGIGGACGSIYSSRVEFNQGIEQAGQLRTEVDRLAKQLGSVSDLLHTPAATPEAQIQLAQKLGELDLKKPDGAKLFHINTANFESVAVERLFTYYDHTAKLYEELTVHAKKTDADKDAITNYLKSAQTRGSKSYAVTYDPSGPIPIAHFAEMGPPVCETPDKTDCPAAELKGFKYRTKSGGDWSIKPVKGKPTDTIIPIEPSELFGTVAAGNADVLAFKDYGNRLKNIGGLSQELAAEQKDVLADLKRRAAERPKVFTF